MFIGLSNWKKLVNVTSAKIRKTRPPELYSLRHAFRNQELNAEDQNYTRDAVTTENAFFWVVFELRNPLLSIIFDVYM